MFRLLLFAGMDRGETARSGAPGGWLTPLSSCIGRTLGVPTEDHASINVCMLGAMGSTLEWFDFAAFGYFSDVFSGLFFPDSDPTLSLLKTFVVFWIAFLFRPIGGVFFGWIGDRYGRKPAVLSAIVTMAASTASMGCLPTYDQVGVLAPILLVLSRSLQGLSVGGQLVGTYAFSIEVAPPKHRCLFGALVSVGVSIGFSLGSAFATLLEALLSPAAMSSVGWRIPFWFGVVAGAGAHYSKHHVEESEDGKTSAAAAATADDKCCTPTTRALRSFWREILLVVGVVSFGANAGYTASVWLANYAKDLLEPPVPYVNVLTTANLLLGPIIMISVAIYADRGPAQGFARVMIVGALTFAITVFPAFTLISTGSPLGFGVGQGLLGMGQNIFWAPVSVWMVETFKDPRCRTSAMGIGYNVAQCCFGGTAPLISTALVHYGGIGLVAYYNIALAVVSIGCVLLGERLRGRQQLGDRGQALLSQPP